MEKKFTHLKTFESFEHNSVEPIDEIFGGKKDYKAVADFLEGDSPEAAKIKDWYDKYIKGLSDKEIRKSPRAKGVMQQITKLGHKWAKENKMAQPKDFSFKQIQTVLEEDYDRKFVGGTDVTIGESKENK